MASPNEEMIRYWNEGAGPRWVDAQALLDAQLEPFGRAVIDRAEPGPGERVLDVGCGCGQTTLQLSERVGPSGRVVGLDVSAPMLDLARRRAEEAGSAGVRFVEADAQTATWEEGFDLVFSRFGVMFFQDPVAAFANLRAALEPGGRLAFACWQELGRNPWMQRPLAAIASRVELPAPADPEAPGPFAFGDPDRVRRILASAGFGDLEVTGVELSLRVGGGGGLEEAADFLTRLGPAAAALREADEATRREVRDAVLEAVRPFETGSGVVMDSAFWIATARRPD